MAEEKLRKSITDLLTYERIARGYTQEDIAKTLNTSKSSISRLESGLQNITVDYVDRFAKAMEMSLELRVSEPSYAGSDFTEYQLKLFDDVLSFAGTMYCIAR